jgi:hypothetical protein
MQASVRTVAFVEKLRKIDLRYRATEAKLREDLIFNGENLFHFIAAAHIDWIYLFSFSSGNVLRQWLRSSQRASA